MASVDASVERGAVLRVLNEYSSVVDDVILCHYQYATLCGRRGLLLHPPGLVRQSVCLSVSLTESDSAPTSLYDFLTILGRALNRRTDGRSLLAAPVAEAIVLLTD